MVNLTRDIDGFANLISRELAENRQEFTEIYDTFTSNELCKEYKEFMEKTMVNIYTLTVGVEENLEILFKSFIFKNKIKSYYHINLILLY